MGKVPDNNEEVQLNLNSGAICFGQWAALNMRLDVPRKVQEITEAKFGFYVRPGKVQEEISRMEKVVALFQRIEWFPQELEVSTFSSCYGDNFAIVDFYQHVDMPADKLIWCFKNIREVFGRYGNEVLDKLSNLHPSATLLVALLSPSKRYDMLYIRYGYDWDDSNIYWERTTQEMYESLISLEEPHWQQEMFFDKEKETLNGYLKSYMMVEDYVYGEDVSKSSYVTEQGVPFIDLPLQFGLDPSGDLVSQEFLEDKINELLGDVL